MSKSGTPVWSVVFSLCRGGSPSNIRPVTHNPSSTSVWYLLIRIYRVLQSTYKHFFFNSSFRSLRHTLTPTSSSLLTLYFSHQFPPVVVSSKLLLWILVRTPRDLFRYHIAFSSSLRNSILYSQDRDQTTHWNPFSERESLGQKCRLETPWHP